jgi:hypothetical protein
MPTEVGMLWDSAARPASAQGTAAKRLQLCAMSGQNPRLCIGIRNLSPERLGDLPKVTQLATN